MDKHSNISRDSLTNEDTVYFDQETTNDDSDFTVVSTLVCNLIVIILQQSTLDHIHQPCKLQS